MLLSWLIDIMIGHWEIQQYQQSNVKMIGWPSIERRYNAKGQIWYLVMWWKDIEGYDNS